MLELSEIKSMSTIEIGELTGKRHSDIIRDVNVILSQAEIDASKFADTYLDTQNRTQKYYKLPRRECDLVVSGYSVKYRLAIIDRWIELESQLSKPVAPQLPGTFAEALQLAADQAKQLEEQAPKIEVYERLADRKSDVNTTTLAKTLGISSIKLNRWLKAGGYKWMSKDLPKAGYESWFNIVCDIRNGHEFTQCLITPKGQIEIAKRYNK